MCKLVASWPIIVTILFLLDAVVWAQDPSDSGGDFDLFPQYDAGRTAFLANCSVCHGDDGKGGVPRSAELNTKPADLTTLAKINNGVFSPGAVYQVIDGRETIAASRCQFGDAGTQTCLHSGEHFTSGDMQQRCICRVLKHLSTLLVTQSRLLEIAYCLSSAI